MTRHTFNKCDTVVFVVTFSTLKDATALHRITNACAHARVVCARQSILGGVTPNGTLMWTRPLRGDPTVLFSGRADTIVPWESAVPQTTFDDQCHVTLYTKLANIYVPCEEVLASGEVPLHVGDQVAYLLPHVPVEEQNMLVVTRVVGFQPSRPCGIQLENGHHNTILAAGQVHLGRYCNGRVQFPLRHLRDFMSKR